MARGNGEGSIFKHRGRWCGQISLGFDKENKRDRRTVYGETKRDVQDQLLKLRQDHRDGRLIDPSRDTVGEFLKRWLDVCIRIDREPKTYECYEVIVRRHIDSLTRALPVTPGAGTQGSPADPNRPRSARAARD